MHQRIDKQALHQECVRMIRSKIEETQAIIQSAGASAQADTKSTAGDKHDTARAMAHIEQEKHAQILSQQQSIENILLRIRTDASVSTVSVGSVVETTMGVFYVAVALGKCTVGDRELFVLSASSPLAKEIQGKTSGSSFTMSGKKHRISDIY